MSSIVEAVQCHLPGFGWILHPVTHPYVAPYEITDETVQKEQFRMFDEPNEKGMKYHYERDEPRKRWVRRGEETWMS